MHIIDSQRAPLQLVWPKSDFHFQLISRLKGKSLLGDTSTPSHHIHTYEPLNPFLSFQDSGKNIGSMNPDELECKSYFYLPGRSSSAKQRGFKIGFPQIRRHSISYPSCNEITLWTNISSLQHYNPLFSPGFITPRDGFPHRYPIFEFADRLRSSSWSRRHLCRCHPRYWRNLAEGICQACSQTPRLFYRSLAGSRGSRRSRMQRAKLGGGVRLSESRHQPHLHRG